MTLYPTCQACEKPIKGAKIAGLHVACYRKALRRLDRKARTNARKSESKLAGRSFQSELERRRADELVLLEKAGKIRDLKFQEVVHLTRAQIPFKTDFSYIDLGTEITVRWMTTIGLADPRFGVSKSNPRVFEEVKGQEFERWRIVKQLWPHYGPGKLTIFKADRRGHPVPVEVIKPKGTP